MIKVKDGYAKLIGTTYSGSVSRVLLSNGGDHILGNSNGNIPLNNGTVNTNLNADMLDGLHIHAGRNNEVNKIVRTDANGFLLTGWINTTSGNIGTGAINKIYCSNDDYIRYKTPANFFPTLANSGNDISITVAGLNRKLTVGYATNADKLDSYHANTIYNAPSFTVNNGNTSNTYILLATITISGTSLACSEFTILFQNRECLDNSSFILSGAIRRNSTTSVGATLSYITLHTEIPRNIYLRSNDGITFMVYIQSAAGTWTTYYRAIPIVDSGNITYSTTGTTSPISGSVLNITATKGGNVNYANSASNADTLDSYHANGLLTALSNSNNGISITVGGTTKSISNISVNYANSAGSASSATKVIVNLHTTNDTNYPLVWSNLANTNTVTENQLYKSWSDLYYNPKNKRLTVGGSVVASSFVKSGGTSLQLLRADGGIATFNWSGQSGLPTWLWGGNNLHSYYVYNPSNFRVAYASSAGNADTLDGVHLSGIFTAFGNNKHNITATIGGVTKEFLVNYASDADKLDGYHASDFASSSHSHNYAANENYGGFTKSGRLPISGFYQSTESESGGNAPWSNWMHLINCLHSNTGNNYALLIAASFFDNNTFKIRVTNNNVNNAWRDIIHSGNIGSQTVANTYHLRINSANTWSTWYWAGLSGQPSWLWGSNDGTNMYVWDPNNFNVNTALYLRSLGNLNCQTGRTLNYGDVYSYNTIYGNTGAPTDYTSVIGFGRGIGGTVEIAGGWCNTGLYWRSLRDCCEDWYSWRTVLDSSNYTGFVDNYYWANVKISTSSSTTTSPTVSNLTATSSIRMGTIYLLNTNEINSASGLHLNYQNSGNVSLCEGGGKVGIGTTAPSYKLDVNGDIRSLGTINCNALNVGKFIINDSDINNTSSMGAYFKLNGKTIMYYNSGAVNINKSLNLDGIACLLGGLALYSSLSIDKRTSTDTCSVLIGSISNFTFTFKKGVDGLILFMKWGDASLDVRVEGGCEIIRSDNFYHKTSSYGDGKSRIFIYLASAVAWYEFYCG